jgi:2-oxoglutarate dehydrogenase E2 component (dihydrolipoamide succinyltransferase)
MTPMTDIRVPTLGESVTEATIGRWFKAAGDAVAVDEPLVELETDKVTIEVPAPAAGVLSEIAAKDGDTVAVGAVLGQIKEGTGAASAKSAAPAAATAPTASAKAGSSSPAAPPKPAAPASAPAAASATQRPAKVVPEDVPLAPSVRRIGAESGIAPETVPGTGKDGRVTKGDMLAAIERAAAAPTPVAQPAAAVQLRAPSPPDDAAREERVRMTRLRQTIARRLKEAQNTAAMLTTFNEVDMSAVMALRAHYRDLFEKKHGVKLGFMGFFVRACVHALKEIPAVNAEIDGTDIIYKNYYHVGIAVGTDKGLVVPVVRDCEAKSLAAIEKEIADYGRRARDGALKIEELQGGTFTITNGGIYGSLMSTPILNAPQTGPWS